MNYGSLNLLLKSRNRIKLKHQKLQEKIKAFFFQEIHMTLYVTDKTTYTHEIYYSFLV